MEARGGRRGTGPTGGLRFGLRPMLAAGNPYPGGLFFLVLTLIVPTYDAIRGGAADATVVVIALAVFVALFCTSQWITPEHPFGWRLGLFAALTAVSAWMQWDLGTSWLITVVLTAVACANLLPLMLGATAGVAVVTAVSGLVDPSPLNLAIVAAAGAISILRGRLLVEIGRSRANRQAYAAAAVENERLRFARDLHDLLGHSLVTMMAKAELAERLAETDPAAAAAAARDVREVGRTAMTQVQFVVAGYRCTSLTEEVDQACRLLAPLRIDVPVSVPERTWSAEADVVLAWAVREGVTNVLRHSNAGRCSITVTVAGDTVRLDVVDNGSRGAVVDAGGSGGNGLVGIRERAVELSGTMAATPTEGGGFRLTVELPLGDPVGAGS